KAKGEAGGAAERPRSRAPEQAPAPAARGSGKGAPPDGLRSSSSGPLLRQPGERPLASPAVRRLALDLGVELRFVRGTGPAGRILKEDLLAYQGRAESLIVAGGPGATTYALREGETAIPVIGLRRRIAQKMQEAKRRIPHFSYVEEVDVTDLETTRAALNARYGATRGKLTVLPLLARALVIAVRDFPQMNARYDDEAGGAGGAVGAGGGGVGGGGGAGGAGVVTRYGPVHLGIATQTDNGLMVPVIRHAEARDPWSCAAEISRLSEAARSGRGTREELSGSTITITSLGPLGGIVTTPVINHPEVAIVGVNKIVERPVVRDATVVVRKLMNLSSSFDHRVVDGMDAAAFVQAIRVLLESPALLFVD
ncbi:MAG: dihydrolipoamide acetyltransferase family protein, partial [Burkholderiaceae bacterium]